MKEKLLSIIDKHKSRIKGTADSCINGLSKGGSDGWLEGSPEGAMDGYINGLSKGVANGWIEGLSEEATDGRLDGSPEGAINVFTFRSKL